MAGAFGGPYASMAGQNQNAGQINGQSNPSGNSASAAGNRSFTSHIAGMSKPQLYDLMSQMKVLIEQNEQQARQILVANPAMTKTLFQAQIMLGMLRPPQVMPNIQQSLSQPPQPQPVQVGPQGQIQPRPQGQMNSVQSQVPPRQPTQMQVGQHGQMPMIPQSQPQSTAMQPSIQRPLPIPQPQMQAPQQSQAHLPLQPASQSMQQPPQGRSLSMHPPIHSAPQNLPMQPQVPTVLSGQPQQSFNQSTTGLHQPVQPPLPQQPRPPMQPPPHQLQNQPTQSLGFQSIVQQQSQSQALFQPGSGQTNMGVPFQPHAQPPLPSQPPPQQLYQMNPASAVGPVSHAGPDISGQGLGHGNLSNVGHGIQPGRGPNMGQGLSSMGPTASWQPVPPESAANTVSGVPHSTIPSGIGGPMSLSGGMIAGMTDSAGQSTGPLGTGMNTGLLDMGGSNMVRSQGLNEMQTQALPQQQQLASHLSYDQEKVLLQQVMSLTPEQISCLPEEHRQQVFQLQQMFRGSQGN